VKDSTSSISGVLKSTSFESAPNPLFQLLLFDCSSRDLYKIPWRTYSGGKGKCSVIVSHFRWVIKDVFATKYILNARRTSTVQNWGLRTGRVVHGDIDFLTIARDKFYRDITYDWKDLILITGVYKIQPEDLTRDYAMITRINMRITSHWLRITRIFIRILTAIVKITKD